MISDRVVAWRMCVMYQNASVCCDGMACLTLGAWRYRRFPQRCLAHSPVGFSFLSAGATASRSHTAQHDTQVGSSRCANEAIDADQRQGGVQLCYPSRGCWLTTKQAQHHAVPCINLASHPV